MLTASKGDTLVVRGRRQGEPDRDAEILEVRGAEHGPPFLVRWSDDGHTGLYFPSTDAFVRHQSWRAGTGGGGRGRPCARPEVDELLQHVHRLTEQVRGAGTTVTEEFAPVPATAVDLLQSIRAVLGSAPGRSAALGVLVEEVRAKHALVRALIEQLEAFDKEREVLERALAPLQQWIHQWQRLQPLVTAPLRG